MTRISSSVLQTRLCRFLIGFSLLLGPSSGLPHTLDCSNVSKVIPNAEISYAEDGQHLRYELAYDLGQYYWLATAFEFEAPFDGNRLLAGIGPDLSAAPTYEVVGNFRSMLLDMVVHPKLTTPTEHRTGSGLVLTFKAVDESFPSVYGFHVRLVEDSVQVFRVSGIARDLREPESPEVDAIAALEKLIKSCHSDEV